MDQFNTWIVRSVTKQQLSSQATSLGDSKPVADEYVLKTVLNIPLTHEADMRHWSNQYRRGKFMEYHLTLVGIDGKVVAEVKSGLTWGDGYWSQVRSKLGHSDQAHHEVMKGYVRKAVDRGIAGLKKALAKTKLGNSGRSADSGFSLPPEP